jgi:hypothetical protein
MDTIHWIFGSLHNWLFGAFSLVLLTLGLTVIVFRRGKSL